MVRSGNPFWTRNVRVRTPPYTLRFESGRSHEGSLAPSLHCRAGSRSGPPQATGILDHPRFLRGYGAGTFKTRGDRKA